MATVRLQLRRGLADDWFDANPTLAAGEIGIETDTNTFKFGDGNTPWNSLEYALSGTVDDYIPLSTKAQAGGVASLDSSGFVPVSQLPPLAKVTVNAVANQGARLALTAETGDIAIQADNGQSYVLSASPASTDANWKALVGSEAVVDTVEASLIAGTGLDKTYDDASGTITIDIDSTVATKTYADQAEADAISTASADATSKANAAQAAAISAAATDATTKANASTSTAASALSSHEADTTNIHGIADTSILTTTTGTQTLTNKTLTSPVINTPTGIVKADVGLSNVDNTSDANKPVSTATAAAIATAKSQAQGYADDQINLVIGAAPAALNTLSELADALADDANFAGTVTSSLATKSPIDSPTFTGTVTLPGSTSIGEVGSTEIGYLNGVTSSVQGQIDTKSPLASPTFTGTVTLPGSTSIGEVGSTEIGYLNGVTSSVQGQIDTKLASATAASTYAPLASPTLTGTVTLPGSTSIGDVGSTEIGYLNGVTSSVQGQIDTKLASETAASTYAPLASPTLTGTVTLPGSTSIGDVGSTEIGYLNGVTSSVQGQIDTKSPLASPTFTGTVTLPGSTSIGEVGSTEIGYLNGVTSSVQGQIDTKLASATAASTYAPLASPTFTGTVTLPTGTVTSAMIADGTIVDADVNASAAIAQSKISGLTSDLALKAPLASPTFTGTVTLPTGTVTSGMIADGTIVDADVNASAAIAQSKISGLTSDLALKADLASPTFTGTVAGITKSMVGLGNVDNTADTAKPVSTAQATAIAAAKAEAIADATSQVNAVIASAPAALNTLDELAAALGDDASFATTVTNSLAAKAPLASPTFTGTVTLPTGTVTSGMIADGTIVDADVNASAAIAQSKISGLTSDLALKADLASPTFTGTVAGITKSMVGLGNVDNTADTAKPVSTAQATAIAAAKAEAIADATSQVNAVIASAPAALNTLDELAAALGDDASFATTVTNSLAAKAPLASPTFTGTVTLPTGTVTSEMIANGTILDADVNASAAIAQSKISGLTSDLALKAPLASPTFTGTVTLPTGTVTSGMIAGGTIVDADVNASAAIAQSKISGLTSDLALKAPLASPTFTGTVTLPTGTVTSGMIADGTIVDADVNASAAIAQSKISGLAASLALKADLASPTFTGTVAGITKSMVGLGNVDNTADTAKPVSTAQSTAIATAKAEAIADATAQVNALLTGAPAALNTLDELAAALGDDANFAASVTTSLGLKVDSLTPISQKTASYTLSSLTERDDLIEMGSATAVTLSIPTDETLNFPIGTSIDILQTGAGQVTIAAVTPGTTTVNATPGLKLRTTWSSCTLLKRAANTWVVFGDLTA